MMMTRRQLHIGLWVLAFLLAVLAFQVTRALGQDTPNVIWGTPISGVTSNTAVLYQFLSRRSAVNLPSELTANTGTQYWTDGTTHGLVRVGAHHWVEITNLTTYTVYASLNCGLQPIVSGSDNIRFNETTPTLSNLAGQWDFRIDPYTSSLPFRVQITKDSAFFPGAGVWNVGVYFVDGSTDFYSSATMQGAVTTATLVIRGR